MFIGDVELNLGPKQNLGKIFLICHWNVDITWSRLPLVKMVKHTQTIRPQQPTNCLSVFDHFVGLTLRVKAYNSIHKFDIKFFIVNLP